MRATGAFDPGCGLEIAAVEHYSDRQNQQPYHGLMIEFAASAVAHIPQKHSPEKNVCRAHRSSHFPLRLHCLLRARRS